MKWRRIAIVVANMCQRCGNYKGTNLLEIGIAKGLTKTRLYCDSCMSNLPNSEGDPRE